MRVLVDVNLSPTWVEVLTGAGHEAVHWADLGELRAPDREVMGWARRNLHVVLTHDLDFGALLAMTGAEGPSVIQLRAQDVLPISIASEVLQVLEAHARVLERGAIVSIDKAAARVRILPLRK